MEPNNDSCTDNCSRTTEEQTSSQELATDAQHEAPNSVAVQLPPPVSDSDSITEGTVLSWRELQHQLISSLLAEKKKKAADSKLKDSLTEQPTKGQFLHTKIAKGNKKLSRDTNRHPAYARFNQRYQATSLQRRAQLLSAALQNAFREIDSTFHRNSAPFVKSPAYIRQRIAAEFPPPPVRTPVFPGYATPLSNSNVSPDSVKPSLPFDFNLEPTTIPLADKERLQAFYDSLPKEMATELAKMVEVHAARAPADAIVSLVLRPLPEHLQVNGKRKFEVNLKYTKLVSVSHSSKRASNKASSSTEATTPSTQSKGIKRTASRMEGEIEKKQKTLRPKKRQAVDCEFVLEKKHLLWPKKHIISMMKNERFPQLSVTAIEKLLRKAYQEYNHNAEHNNTAQPRWAYTSLRRFATGLCRAIETACCDKIALNEVLTLATSLNQSLVDDDNLPASKTTNAEIEARWELFSSLERSIHAAFRNIQPTTSVHIAQIWSRIEKLIQTGSSTACSTSTPVTTTTTSITITPTTATP